MSKHRKPREQPSHGPETTRAPLRPLATQTPPFSRTLLRQLLAIVGLSTVLGFTFNSASPVGVRFDEPTSPPTPAPAQIAKTENVPPQNTPATLAVVVPPKPTNVVVAAVPPRPTSPPKPIPPAPSVTPPSIAPPTQSPTNPLVVVTTPPATPQVNPAPIHWPEAKALTASGSAILVDVRHKPVFDAGHIPGAVSLPEMSSPDDFKNLLAQQPAGRTVIVYCSSTSCSQSARVAARLVSEFHWPAVRYMTGGYAEYQQLELAKPAPPAAASAP